MYKDLVKYLRNIITVWKGKRLSVCLKTGVKSPDWQENILG